MANKTDNSHLAELNETGRRSKSDRRQKTGSPTKERRKTTRRRQIDPTTCEREYSDAEIEFMQALDDYKRRSGRMFPTCSEILEVLSDLGYQKVENGGNGCCQTGTIADRNATQMTNF